MGALFGDGLYYLLDRRSVRAAAEAATLDEDERWPTADE